MRNACTAIESQSKSQNNPSTNTQRRSNVASFNVRGLNDALKRAALTRDLTAYKIGICCLQETKFTELSDEVINNTRIIMLTGKFRHNELGFALNKYWATRLKSYETIDDRIAIATFTLSKNASMKIVNIYAPTQAKSDADVKVRDAFYGQLEAVLSKMNQQTTLLIAGDFNSKIGVDWSETNCIGRYGRV